MADVAAAELARELNVSVSVLLQRADDEINRVVAEEGLDAARGLTTRIRGGHVYLTPELAVMLVADQRITEYINNRNRSE